MARIGRANAKNLRTLNPAHKPTQGEQNCLSPSDALVEFELGYRLRQHIPLWVVAHPFLSHCRLPKRRATRAGAIVGGCADSPM